MRCKECAHCARFLSCFDSGFSYGLSRDTREVRFSFVVVALPHERQK